jgi:predicted nucleotidyltransferase
MEIMPEVYTQDGLVTIITSLLKKYHAENAILFGSYARKEADRLSDIDLLVIGGPLFDPTDIFSLADDLHRATGKSVDVYELREINQQGDFYQTILKEGVHIAA